MEGKLEFDNSDWEHFIDEKEGFCKFFPELPNSKVFEFRTTEVITKMNMNFHLKIEVALEIFESRMKLDFLQMVQNNITLITVSYLKRLNINIESRGDNIDNNITNSQKLSITTSTPTTP
jgi:hypothetical protein